VALLLHVRRCLLLCLQVLHENYVLATAVLLGEAGKLLISLAMLVLGVLSPEPVPLAAVPRHLFEVCTGRSMLLMGVPGIMYFFHNQLIFIALQHVNAATYAILTQLKFLAAAGQRGSDIGNER
jgi:drug/metabolite transporter (DMT)-like permease